MLGSNQSTHGGHYTVKLLPPGRRKPALVKPVMLKCDKPKTQTLVIRLSNFVTINGVYFWTFNVSSYTWINELSLNLTPFILSLLALSTTSIGKSMFIGIFCTLAFLSISYFSISLCPGSHERRLPGVQNTLLVPFTLNSFSPFVRSTTCNLAECLSFLVNPVMA